MNVRDATADDLTHVLLNMRDVDHREIFATRWTDDRMALIDEVLEARKFAIKQFAILADDGDPVTILGAYLIAPRRATVHRVSTGRWKEVARTVFRFGTTVFVPAVLEPTVDKAECAILDEHTAARHILIKLGFALEGVQRRHGKNGENFALFGWINPHATATATEAG